MFRYKVHSEDEGWQDYRVSGQLAGSTGKNKRIEALVIDNPEIPEFNLTYKVHVSDIGWMDAVICGEVAGTEGQGKAIEAIQISKFGDKADDYDVWYQLHIQDYGWTRWTKNGGLCGTEGGGKQAEAIAIILCERDALRLDGDTDFKYLKFETQKPPNVNVQQGMSKQLAGIELAQAYVGYLSNPDYGDLSIFSEYFGSSGDYCHAFVSFVGVAVGAKDIPQTCWCPDGYDYYKKRGRLHYRDGYIPKTLDLIYFDRNYNDYSDHVGFVESANSEIVNTIEGNAGSPRGVVRKTYRLTDPDIHGFGEVLWD